MEKRVTFGNAVFAEKMANRFGEPQEPVRAEMTYTADVEEFIKKLQNAHKEAHKSKVVFG